MSKNPSISDVFSRVFSRALNDIRISLPGIVESYDSTQQKVNVTPAIKEAREDETLGDVSEALPVITDVPVIFPGAGVFRLTFPISAGDTGLIVFSSRSLEDWLSLGGTVEPADKRRFSLTDAVFIPGLRPFSDPLASPPDDALTIGVEGGAQGYFKTAEINLGSDTPAELQFVALADKVLTELTALVNAFNAHVHASPAGPTAVPSVLKSAPSSVAGSVVKAKV
jgi:hypothetical protein